MRKKVFFSLFALLLTICLLAPPMQASAAEGVLKSAEVSLSAYTVPSSVTPVTINVTKSGTLSTSDPHDPLYPSCYADAYSFSGKAGQPISITEYSTAFSPFFSLFKKDSSTSMSLIGSGGTSTGNTGTASFTLPSDGTYIIIASSYASNKTGAYTIRVNCNYAITGKITKVSATGAPLAGATISVAGKTAVSNLDGTYTVTGLTVPKGLKSMTVSKTGYTSKTLSVNVTYPSATVNTYLVPTVYYSVSGKITNSSGAALSGATVKLAGKTVTTNSAGNYTVTGVANDTYTMTVSKSGYGSQTKVITVNGSNKTGVNFTLAAGATLPYVGLSSSAKALSLFNGDQIYSITGITPASKPQGSGTPPTAVFSIITNGPTASIAANQRPMSLGSTALASSAAVFGKGQLLADEWLRAEENKRLASGARQYDRALNKVLKSPAPPITVGTVWNGVKLVITDPVTTINTVCRRISQKAYYFVDVADWPAGSADGTGITKAELASYATAFDNIYASNLSHFGAVRDVDGNGKVIIVFSKKLTGGLLGYFYSGDKYPTSSVPSSNQGDIFYITTDNYTASTIKGTLAHELQHMIYYDQHYIRGVTSTYAWLNEALSQGAEYYTGYTDNHNAWMRYFLSSGWPGLSLTHWTSGNYGYGAVFMRYLIDQYGATAVKNMCATDKVGIQAVEAATGKDFNVIFNNFTRAIVMDDTGDSSNPLFRFSSLNLRTLQPNGRGGLLPGWTFSSGTDLGGNFYAYSLAFIKWTGSFGTMSQSGTGTQGTAFGLNY